MMGKLEAVQLLLQSAGVTTEATPEGTLPYPLMKTAQCSTKTPPDQKKAAFSITADLGYLPLALEQAGAYISIQQCTLTSYLKESKNLISKILSKKWTNWGYKVSILATWEISFEAIRKERPEAAELLLLCGFLANDDLFKAMFLKRFEGKIHSTQRIVSYHAKC